MDAPAVMLVRSPAEPGRLHASVLRPAGLGQGYGFNDVLVPLCLEELDRITLVHVEGYREDVSCDACISTAEVMAGRMVSASGYARSARRSTPLRLRSRLVRRR